MENNLRYYRLAAGLSQIEAGAKIYVSNTTICKYEKGHVKKELENVSLLADLYGVTLDDICKKVISAEEKERMEDEYKSRNHQRLMEIKAEEERRMREHELHGEM